MLFNSLHFLAFFPVVVAAYFSIPHRYRWLFLLIASYYFYMAWEPAYGLLILFSTTVDYFAALYMEKTKRQHTRKLLLYGSLAANLGLLFTFKYFNFFFDSLESFINVFNIDFSGPTLTVLLPIGISFYTFQSLSYTIDVYRGARKPEKHFGIFALYVSFFPQLVAGPIERSTRLLPQFYKKIEPHAGRATSGLRLMLWGFFKKIVVADNAGRIVDAVYGNPSEMNGIALAAATLFFAVQIYADFSGYTDIARGSARILGYELMLNFKRPYAARTISEFWNRWHISLTSWFQDYVFKPLYLKVSHAKNLQTVAFRQRHIISFSIASLVGLTLLGLWHGANMTFVFFGLSQAIFIIFYQLVRSWWDRLHALAGFGITALMVLISFVFFRAENMADAWYIFGGIGTDLLRLVTHPEIISAMFTTAIDQFDIYTEHLLVLLVTSFTMFTVEGLYTKKEFVSKFHRAPWFIRWIAYYILIVAILVAGDHSGEAFIYFQF